ncbi:DUF2627 domain-containing protein [Jeotgalibacillus proteolyticus]|uniref:DUF2627 domain-containing protein n=1 Tax=Jeotgalibacillus proteolyticus TaxID=2082395 RepID=A0A2S5GEE7_9BACL|nr:DUF2627 domain-containing protein [Jeotgalibacillus proteolyticus]PPA71359.1 DUF2627 domain-containing protein [Jeotgalibacillus proteolyticus]
MSRMIALIILLIPGILAGYGIKLMRDMLFGLQASWIPALWLQFVLGFLFMVLGVGFIGGFLLRRDRKNNKVQERFRRQK